MPKRSDITDRQVVEAAVQAHTGIQSIARTWKEASFPPCSLDQLVLNTGLPYKVCLRAFERASKRGMIDYGVSLRTAWATPEGRELL